MLGSANISGSKAMHLMTGNLCHQIEHHIFPDLPTNRYAEIAPKVQALFEKYGLNYHTAPMSKQVASAWHRVVRLSLPNGWLATTKPSNAPKQLATLYKMTHRRPPRPPRRPGPARPAGPPRRRLRAEQDRVSSGDDAQHKEPPGSPYTTVSRAVSHVPRKMLLKKFDEHVDPWPRRSAQAVKAPPAEPTPGPRTDRGGTMGYIKSGLFISLDGVIEAPETWHFPYFNDEMGAVVGELMAGNDAMLLGRQTYDEFAGYWPNADPDDPFTGR